MEPYQGSPEAVFCADWDAIVICVVVVDLVVGAFNSNPELL